MIDNPCPGPGFDLKWPCPTSIPAETPLLAAHQLTQDCQCAVRADLEDTLGACERAAAAAQDLILRDLSVSLASVEGTVEHVLAGVSDLHVATGSVPVLPIWQCLPAWAQGLLAGLSLCPCPQPQAPAQTAPLPSRSGGAGIGRDVEIGPQGRLSVTPDELEQMVAVQVEAILARLAASGSAWTPPSSEEGVPAGIHAVPPAGADAASSSPGPGAVARGDEQSGGLTPPPGAPARLLSLIELSATSPLPEPGEIDWPPEEGEPAPADLPPDLADVVYLPPVPPAPWEAI